MFADDLLMIVYVDQRVVMRERNKKLCLLETNLRVPAASSPLLQDTRASESFITPARCKLMLRVSVK